MKKETINPFDYPSIEKLCPLKNPNNKIKIAILVVLIFSASMGSLWAYEEIIKPNVTWVYDEIVEPAILSARHACRVINDTQLRDAGFRITGTFNKSDSEIAIYYYEVDSIEYQRTLKHEQCHKKIFLENRSSGCGLNYFGDPIWLILEEIQCNIAGYV